MKTLLEEARTTWPHPHWRKEQTMKTNGALPSPWPLTIAVLHRGVMETVPRCSFSNHRFDGRAVQTIWVTLGQITKAFFKCKEVLKHLHWSLLKILICLCVRGIITLNMCPTACWCIYVRQMVSKALGTMPRSVANRTQTVTVVFIWPHLRDL